MPKVLYLLLIATAVAAMACSKKAISNNATGPLEGVWVREDDQPGKLPADTLTFATKNGTNVVSFYSAGSPGPGWPSNAETEYRFANGKFSYRNYFDASTDFFEVESFQWITQEKSFSVRLYQIVRFMSADYRVTYHKIN